MNSWRPRRSTELSKFFFEKEQRKPSCESLERRRLLSGVFVGDSNHAVVGQDQPVAPSVAAQVVGYNPASHQQQLIGVSSTPEAAETGYSAGYSAPGRSPVTIPGGRVPTQTTNGEVSDPNFIFSPDGRTAVGAGNMTSYPWRTIGRMWIVWPDGSEASATGEMIGPRDFLTAGHCVYQAEHGGWASQIYFSPGQDGTEINDPYFNTTFRRSDNQYYGEAAGTYYRSYTGWTSSGNYDYDMAVVTLDRNIGNFTGWMGYGYNDNDSFFSNQLMNTAGYPGDLTPSQYDMFSTADRLTTVNTLNLQSNLIDIYPGQSGSPVYYYDGTNRTIYATVSSEWSNTTTGAPLYNQFTRITSSRYADINNDKTADGTATDLPDLTSYDEWYNSNYDYHTATTTRGGQLSFTSYIRNIGTGTANGFYVNFYISPDSTISTSDTLLGSTYVPAISAFNFGTASLTATVPGSLGTGNYYVGYTIDSTSADSEYAEYNNVRLMPGTVSLTAISPDRFEPNDTLATATNFGTLSGTRTEAGLSIHASGNGDFYRFTAAANGTLSASISFSNAAGDTDMQLLNASSTVLTGSYSTSDSESFNYAVTRGTTYFLSIYGYGGSVNPSYSLTLTGPVIAADRFEANDSFAGATNFGTLGALRSEPGISINAAGNGDYYRFTAGSTGTLGATINFIHADGDIDMQLLNSAGSTIATSAGVSNSEHIETSVTAGTTYTLYVYGYANAINWNYDLALGVGAAPNITSQAFQFNTARQQLQFAFDQDVSASLATSDLVLTNTTDSTVVPTANIALAYNSVTNTATFTFPGYAGGVLPDGNYHAALASSGVTNAIGLSLASAGSVDFFALGGDFNHDRSVNVADLGVLASSWQASGKTFAQGDANYDGVVNVADLGILASNWQHSLPSGFSALSPGTTLPPASGKPGRSSTALAANPAPFSQVAASLPFLTGQDRDDLNAILA